MNPDAKRAVFVLLGPSSLVALIAVSLPFAVEAPTVRATIETALILCGLASVSLVWTPWSHSRRTTDLLLLAALLTLTLEDFEFFAAPAMAGSGASTFGVGTSLVVRLVVAAVFVAALVVPHHAPTAERSRAIMLLAVLAICPVALRAAAFLLPGLSAGSRVARETTGQVLILGIPAICLLIAAAGGFVRSALGEPTGMIEAMLGASLILLAAAWAFDLLLSEIAAHSVTGSECFRAGSFGLIMIVALKVRADQRRAEMAEVAARERRRLAGYLHDGMAQDLVVIAAHGERLTRDLGVEHPVVVAARQALACGPRRHHRPVRIPGAHGDRSPSGGSGRARSALWSPGRC